MRDFESNPYTQVLHQHPYQICTQCVMDTSDPAIAFDAQGICNHCRRYEKHLTALGNEESRRDKLAQIVDTVRRAGKHRDYDCIMGLSGGVDSSFLSHYAVNVLHLRVLVVHVDSGWNSELAVGNIERICKLLNIDLHTLVLDWDEMRDLQRSYFLSGVANLDVPQDHAFNSALIREAKKYRIRHVLNGGNMQTESILPAAWGYDASDPINLRAIHKRFGTAPLRTYPVRSDVCRFLLDPHVFGMRVHRPLEYIDYNKFAAKQLLKERYGWRDYGGKHYESRFTKLFQAHYLPTKFGYDKRKAHLASLVVSGQLTRDQALAELAQPLYDPRELELDIAYFCKKLGLSRAEFDKCMHDEPHLFSRYPNRVKTYSCLRRISALLSTTLRRVCRRRPRSA